MKADQQHGSAAVTRNLVDRRQNMGVYKDPEAGI